MRRKHSGTDIESILSVLDSDKNTESKSTRGYKDKINREKLQNIRQDRILRAIFAFCIFAFICVYMIMVFVILFKSAKPGFSISESVLITLLTTTLVNVFGLFVYVLKYLFGNNERKELS